MVSKFLIGTFAIISVSSIKAQSSDSTIYPAVVKFQSECCGVPGDTPLKNALASFKKKYKVKKITATHIGPMGREGEYYLAFTLKELSNTQSACFIEKIGLTTKKMTDRGSAVLEKNMKIDLSELPRVRVSEVVF